LIDLAGKGNRLRLAAHERRNRSHGAKVRGEGRIYITRGGTAVWEGWRAMTIDADLKAEPELPGFYEAIAELKESIDINIELASPDDFIPPLPGWRERSPFVARHGRIDFHHFDLFSQALSKIERGHPRDLIEVAEMLRRGLIDRRNVWRYFEAIEPELNRYPAIEPRVFRDSVLAVIEDAGSLPGA
jgi:hypothetical protein